MKWVFVTIFLISWGISLCFWMAPESLQDKEFTEQLQNVLSENASGAVYKQSAGGAKKESINEDKKKPMNKNRERPARIDNKVPVNEEKEEVGDWEA